MTGLARFFPAARRILLVGSLGAVSLASISLATANQAAAQNKEIVVSINRVTALDKYDGPVGNKADFFARVTISGTTFTTKPIRQQDDIRPNWIITKPVGDGKHDVKLEILDSDVTNPPDPIDINRVDKKRDLDFTVDTRRCIIEGFVVDYRCRTTISRAGAERKKAAISFTVNVRQR
jgi:hypothetical protein